MPIIETQRERRGHDFMPPAAELAAVPELYSQDGKGIDAVVQLHYFGGACDWYITEYDMNSGVAFGWADLGDGEGEFGYMSLQDLEAVSVMNGLVIVERDLFWDPKPLRQILGR